MSERKVLIEVINDENCIIVNKVLKLDVIVGDNMMVLEDEFKSSYECKECGGTGEKKVTCLKCNGTGKGETLDFNPQFVGNCGRCDGAGYRMESCRTCNGKGALLEIPDIAKKKPTSGTIVSIGPDVKVYKVGERIAYSGYIGHFLPFSSNDRVKVMREHEAMCRITDITPDKSATDHIEFASSDDPYDDVRPSI